MRTKSLKKNKINVITLGCSKNIYDSGVNGSTPCERKDVAHEAPAAEEETLLSLQALLIMPKESVNMILEYADKKNEVSRQSICDWMFIRTLQT
jgi:ribosomal protein S12 methylthiotransferase